MKKWGKVVAVVLVVAIVFGIWQGPIKSRADKLANENAKDSSVETLEENKNIDSEEIQVDESEIVNKFTIPCEDDEKSYTEYVITNTHIICTYYKYIGDDEEGNPTYNKKASKTEIIPEISVDEINEDEPEDNDLEDISRGDNISRGEGSPLYWQKIVKENLKKVYYYQVGVKGEDVYYRIGGKQSVAVNFSNLNDNGVRDVRAFIDQVDLVNKQLAQCILAAIGAVMMAISAIIASYVTVGATVCGTLIAPILKQFGVQLISLSPIGFGQMVFKMYDDYQDLKEMYCQAATYGSIFTP